MEGQGKMQGQCSMLGQCQKYQQSDSKIFCLKKLELFIQATFRWIRGEWENAQSDNWPLLQQQCFLQCVALNLALLLLAVHHNLGVGEKGKVRALIQAAGQSEAEDSRKNTKHKMKTCQTPTESAAFKISRNK